MPVNGLCSVPRYRRFRRSDERNIEPARDRTRCSRPRPSSGMLGHELEDQVRNLVRLFVQREMPSVEQVDFRIR